MSKLGKYLIVTGAVSAVPSKKQHRLEILILRIKKLFRREQL